MDKKEKPTQWRNYKDLDKHSSYVSIGFTILFLLGFLYLIITQCNKFPYSDEELKKLEEELAELYPNIDFSKDPADAILNDLEFQNRIDELLSQ